MHIPNPGLIPSNQHQRSLLSKEPEISPANHQWEGNGGGVGGKREGREKNGRGGREGEKGRVKRRKGKKEEVGGEAR